MTNFFEKVDAMVTNIYSTGGSLTIDGVIEVLRNAKLEASEGLDVACAVRGTLDQMCKGIRLSNAKNIEPETMAAVGDIIGVVMRDGNAEHLINGETCAIINFAGEALCDNADL